MANKGLGWGFPTKKCHNPGGHCYWEGAIPNLDIKPLFLRGYVAGGGIYRLTSHFPQTPGNSA